MSKRLRTVGLLVVLFSVTSCSAETDIDREAEGEADALADDGEPSETTEDALTTGFGLPFPAGAAYRITQGPYGGYSHVAPYNQHAVDFGMPTGARVVASGAGRVAYSGWFSGEIRVILDHGGNRCTLYTHLNRALPAPGSWVRRGQHIGESGATGRVSAPHLHWAMINCSNWTSRAVVPTDELGTSYRVGAVAVSRNVYR